LPETILQPFWKYVKYSSKVKKNT